jgi:hypothetical protein
MIVRSSEIELLMVSVFGLEIQWLIPLAGAARVHPVRLHEWAPLVREQREEFTDERLTKRLLPLWLHRNSIWNRRAHRAPTSVPLADFCRQNWPAMKISTSRQGLL